MWTYTPVAWVGLKRAFGWGGENTGVEEGGGCEGEDAHRGMLETCGCQRWGSEDPDCCVVFTVDEVLGTHFIHRSAG
jgi:hypothetical protein